MTDVRVREDLGAYEDIAAAAVRAVGLDDLGGSEHEQGLRLLVDDLAAPSAGLTGEGFYQQRQQVKAALVGRLLSQSGFTAHPAYEQQRIERPVFVLGLTRTGTTALHRLLVADARHQGLELWLAEYPRPRPPRATWDADPVYAGISAAYGAHQQADPEFMGVHYTDASTVEECWRLLRQSGTSIAFESLAHVPRYAAWLQDADWLPAYRRHRANLQLIGLDDDRRWVLKNPSHLAALDALMTVYPDALIVRTHRDPVVSFASACSLSASATAGWSTTFTGATIGADQLAMLSRCHRDFEAARRRYDPAQFVDVDYRDLVGDPIGTVRSIYDRFDLGWNDRVAEAVGAVDAESRRGPRAPSHRYELADYGVTEDDVRAAFT